MKMKTWDYQKSTDMHSRARANGKCRITGMPSLSVDGEKMKNTSPDAGEHGYALPRRSLLRKNACARNRVTICIVTDGRTARRLSNLGQEIAGISTGNGKPGYTASARRYGPAITQADENDLAVGQVCNPSYIPNAGTFILSACLSA